LNATPTTHITPNVKVGQRALPWFADKGKHISGEKCASAIRVRHAYRNMPPWPCAHFHSYFISVQFFSSFKTRPLFFLNISYFLGSCADVSREMFRIL
jgi:hypothetical protein